MSSKSNWDWSWDWDFGPAMRSVFSGTKKVLRFLWRLFLIYEAYELIQSYRYVRRFLGLRAAYRWLDNLFLGFGPGRTEVSIVLGIIIGFILFRRRRRQKQEAEKAKEAAEAVPAPEEPAETPAEEEYIPPSYHTFNS